jgi:glycolate oxidase
MERSQLVMELERLLDQGRVISDPVDLLYYSYDSSFLARLNKFIPDAVVTPRSTEEVSAVMRFAYENGIPVTPRGAGSGETCGGVAIQGGIVMDLSTWDTVEEIDVPNMQVIVRPGVVHAKLNEQLSGKGMFSMAGGGVSQPGRGCR